jgi:hypothetical protein
MSNPNTDTITPTADGDVCPIIDLNRQVRIVAGSFVVLGVVLGFLVHRAFFGLSGFVGAGLVFAGITDICGLCHVLKLLPWNRPSRS